MSNKHIIIIHGRSEKPSKIKKNLLVKKAFEHGLDRVSGGALQLVEDKTVKVSCVYYGDINNAIIQVIRKLRAEKPQHAFNLHPLSDEQTLRDILTPQFISTWPNEPKQKDYSKSMNMLFDIPTDKQDRANYDLLKDGGKAHLDDLARFWSKVSGWFGVSDDLLNFFAPDLGAYFEIQAVGSAVRKRLTDVLLPAWRRGEEVCLMAHSMGTGVAWDTLWKISHTSEYLDVRDKKVDLFITLGCPFGEEGFREQLKGSGQRAGERFPQNITHWHNFTAQDDFVAHDARLANNFGDMPANSGLQGPVIDHKIHTFWIDNKSEILNPHKFYGYLDNHEVAQTVSDWI